MNDVRKFRVTHRTLVDRYLSRVIEARNQAEATQIAEDLDDSDGAWEITDQPSVYDIPDETEVEELPAG